MIDDDSTKAKRRAKGTGSVYSRSDSPVLWIKYSRNGKTFRESTGTTNPKKAKDMLKHKLATIVTGTFVPPSTERIRVSELTTDMLRDYRVNSKKSIDDLQARWELHLTPFFGHLRVCEVTSTEIAKYVDARKLEGAQNATINRELAALKRAFHLGAQSTPRKVSLVPHFGMLHEDNTRLGFLEPAQRDKLATECAKVGLWLRAIFELGVTTGWRHGEVLNLRVRNLDLAEKTIRLDVGTTKNGRGRLVVMTEALYVLLSACAHGKGPDDFVFTRSDERPVKDFRDTWARSCCAAGVGQMVCAACNKPMTDKQCSPCGSKKRTFRGLLFHDLRRSAVRNMIRSGISQQVAKQISGHATDSVFSRYNVTSTEDLKDAARKMEKNQTGAEFVPDKVRISHVELSAQLSQFAVGAEA